MLATRALESAGDIWRKSKQALQFSTSSERNVVIDVLRAGSILYVVGYWHLSEYSPALASYATPLTRPITTLALGAFVFISGLLLSRRWTLRNRQDVAGFYRNRLVRVYPMYLIALTAFLLGGRMDMLKYIRSALLMNMFTGEGLLTLWFVTMIFVFYAITPLYLRSFAVGRDLILTLVLYVGLIGLHMALGWIDLRLPLYLPAFAAGILAARSERVEKLAATRAAVVISAFCVLGFGWMYGIVDNEILRLFVADLLILSSMPLLFSTAKVVSRIADPGAVYRLSYASFALYLIHRIAFTLAVRLYQPRTLPASVLYLESVVLVTIALSYVFQLSYDRLSSKLIARGHWMRARLAGRAA